ncbi:hypothetical protein H5410_061113 [Solanum commersonii]|uniref:Uncharacterized protein n=1 Tax=Solanum commersonii TaxID=4109 RepID=A0A9J5W6U1_SOLCO|nr:hypothetical protein H5410_061113 [Solanum commersonii]
MAAQPSVVVLRPPDQVKMMHNSETQLQQQESPTNSKHNSMNLNSSPKLGVIQIVPIDGMNSTPIELPIVTKSNDSLLPIERSAKANYEESSPKSPQNSNEHSSDLRQILEVQNTLLDSTQHNSSNHININYVNERNNSSKDFDQSPTVN